MDPGKYWDVFVQGYTGYARYLWQEVTHPGWNNYFYWLIGVSLVFFAWEYVRPWRKAQGAFPRDFRLDVFYMFFNFFLFSLIGYNAVSNVFVELFQDILRTVFGVENLVAIALATWPVALQLFAMFMVRDFIQWNIHRLLHRVPWLWQFHKVHHSAPQLGFATHLRYHWMETVVYRTLEYIPLAMIGFGIQQFFIVHIITLAIGHFNHSNVRVNLGPLRYILNNPQMHAWHHAKHVPSRYRFGINFGLSLSVWDYLFGTAHVPHSGENIELGYPGDEEMPATFSRQFLFPWSRKSH